MRSVLVLLFVAVGLVSMLGSRFAGFLLYTWFAFFRPQEWTYNALVDLRLSLLIAISFASSCLLTGIFPNVTHRLSVASLVVLGSAVVAHLNAMAPEASLAGLLKLSVALSMVLLGVTLINSRERLFWSIAVVAGSLGFHGAKVGLGSLIRGGARFTTVGLGGMFSDNNDFALAIARNIFLLLVVVLLVRRRSVKLGFMAAVPLSAVAVFSTYSRGAFLATAAGIGVYLWAQPRRYLYLSLATLLGGFLYLVVPPPEEYVERITTISTYEEVNEGSALSRLHFWAVAVDMVKAYPLGVGLGNYRTYYDSFDSSLGAYGSARAVHSTHFEILSETGLLGTAAYVYLIVASTWILLRTRGRALKAPGGPDREVTAISTALLASLAAFVVGGSFLAQALNEMNWFLFGFVAALDRILAAERLAVAEPIEEAPSFRSATAETS